MYRWMINMVLNTKKWLARSINEKFAEIDAELHLARQTDIDRQT